MKTKNWQKFNKAKISKYQIIFCSNQFHIFPSSLNILIIKKKIEPHNTNSKQPFSFNTNFQIIQLKISPPTHRTSHIYVMLHLASQAWIYAYTITNQTSARRRAAAREFTHKIRTTRSSELVFYYGYKNYKRVIKLSWN